MSTTKHSGDGLSNLQPTTLEVAQQYLKHGWAIIPIPRGRKNPTNKEWQKLRITEENAQEHFNGQPQNVGVLLGTPSGNLIDIDLDCEEAVRLAPHFLPETRAIFGRTSKPQSHYAYYSEIEQRKFKAPDGRMILELRSNGGQTVFPGSIHPSGESVEWACDGTPSHVSPDEISRAVGKLAACSLLAQVWNVATGSRHDLALAIAGGLARAGWSEDDAIKLIGCAAEIAGDDELEDREHAIRDTFQKLGTNVKGWPTVAEITGDKTVEKMRDFLSIASKNQRQMDDVPTIQANDRLPSEIADEALAALVNANDPPVLFVRGGKLTRVRSDENGRPIIEALTVEHLRERLGRVARFVNPGKRGNVTIQTPLTVVQDIRARASWPFPPLEAITETPTLRQDGSILLTPGYDPMTRLIYHPVKGFTMPSVPDTPTPSDMACALGTIIDSLQDFPFLDQASRANVLALLLTPLIRAHVPLAPLALIDAPQAGTGKGLLTDVASIIASGRSAAKNSPPRDDDELEKRITALLSEGATFIVFDDLAHVLRSPKLANALTASIWKGRMLGRSEMVEVPQRATWIVTGNNIQLGGDIARRCFWIRLDAKTSRPYRRADFKHSDLLGHVGKLRGDLLGALFTLARAWQCAGRPPSSVKPLGSFEDWTRIIGGILEHAGLTGFLANADELYEQADDETVQWETFIEVCNETFGNAPITTAELSLELSGFNSKLAASLPDFLADVHARGNGDFKKLLGQALSRRVDRRYGDSGWHIERGEKDTHKKVARWKFVKTKEERR